MKKSVTGFACTVLLALLAAPTHAHLVETGFGEFYDGVAHVAVTPADLLLVIALALLAGQHGQHATRFAVLALPLAWLIGGLLGAGDTTLASASLLTTLTFAATGALVALKTNIRSTGIYALVIACGLLHGFENGRSLFAAGYGQLAFAGVISAVFVVTAVLAAEVKQLPAGWPQISVRVAGSWIAATGMLMFGWLAHSLA